MSESFKLYLCTLDSCVSYYLVSAEFGSDCFDIIDRTEHITAIGAYPSALTVEPATEQLLAKHHVIDDEGRPMLLHALAPTLIMSEVLWSSEWS